MKNIICLLSEKISAEKQLEIVNCLRRHAAALNLPFKIDLFQQEGINSDYQYAIAGFFPENALKRFPHLELVLSLNAGVDDILKEISPPTRLGRIIHLPAINRMKDYVLYCILDYTLMMDKYRKNQALAVWDRHKPFSVLEDTIGIMGLGNVGQLLATNLTSLGKSVQGYSNTPKSHLKKSFAPDELDSFLSQTNILVNALPLNPSTQGILNKHTLQALPDNSCIINVGRGGHIVDVDLLAALNTPKLSRVYLDVFATEPLPKEHSFWQHEKIFLTPHISGVFDVMDVLPAAMNQLKTYYEQQIIVNEVKL